MPKGMVLALDDEPRVTRLLQVNLERAGFAVEVANDSVAALEALQSGQIKPDLIVMDVTMPYLDGFEILSALKADPNLLDIPVILLTARMRDEDILLGQDLGAAHYLVKPFATADLIALVEKALGPPDRETRG